MTWNRSVDGPSLFVRLVFGKNVLNALELVFVALSRKNIGPVSAGADTDVSCNASTTLCVYCSMTVVDRLGYLRPGAFDVGSVSTAERPLSAHSYGRIRMPY